jgi:hypothetical protein
MSVAQDEPSTPQGAAPPWAQPGARLLVRFESVRKRYSDVSAVDGVRLDIFEREFFFGPSGCGKRNLWLDPRRYCRISARLAAASRSVSESRRS